MASRPSKRARLSCASEVEDENERSVCGTRTLKMGNQSNENNQLNGMPFVENVFGIAVNGNTGDFFDTSIPQAKPGVYGTTGYQVGNGNFAFQMGEYGPGMGISEQITDQGLSTEYGIGQQLMPISFSQYQICNYPGTQISTSYRNVNQFTAHNHAQELEQTQKVNYATFSQTPKSVPTAKTKLLKTSMTKSQATSNNADAHAHGFEITQPQINFPFLQNYSTLETFCTVPGRTSLLSSTTKYKVTIGEIQRRISPPENLNASLLGGILRKAKSKDGGKTLRESLKRIGLSLPAGRRKSACVTAWTALVEEEAIHMAKDFHTACVRDFPSREIAEFLVSGILSPNFGAHSHPPVADQEFLAIVDQRRSMLESVRTFIKEFSELMNADRSPICGSRADLVLNPSIQKPLTHFSLITHGFGGLAVVAVVDALNNCVNEALKQIERTYGQQTSKPMVSVTRDFQNNFNSF